jgi:HEPN/Toprim N-terminal domain 1
MGSYCTLCFDNLEVCSAKSAVPDELCALFQESDRRTRKSRDAEQDEESDVVYEASRDVILDRLALFGCTKTIANERFAAWLESERSRYASYIADGNWAADTMAALQALTPEEWCARVPGALAKQHNSDEAFDAVALDITDLIGGGWIGEDEAICAERRDADTLEPRPFAPVVIFTEGSSDIRILQRSLAILFPERQDYFSFFNHAELNVDGGAIYLVKFLKAFAAARAPLRIVALFDNDAAGLQAFRLAKSLNLPNNIIALRLPDIEIARAYPTIGPQGRHVVDVNGQAASIELYLGRAALSREGGLRPVRWTGYVQAATAYQGEVEDKADVEAAFTKAVVRFTDKAEARAAFPELADCFGDDL